MRKRYSRSYTVLSFLTMFSYREQPSGRTYNPLQEGSFPLGKKDDVEYARAAAEYERLVNKPL